jgi:hypothetical protein
MTTTSDNDSGDSIDAYYSRIAERQRAAWAVWQAARNAGAGSATLVKLYDAAIAAGDTGD